MTTRRRPGEFELIARCFAPLAAGSPGALGLTDDAAFASPAQGCRHVLAVDTLVEGVHFLADDPADLVARKLLRVNLSDLAAMGAEPKHYLLAISLPDTIDAEWVERFASGLAADQAAFGVGLIGGDTTATPGPLTLTLTAVGEAPVGTELLRSGARPGDEVYVSGTIGDAALGVQVLKGERGGLDEEVAAALADRYRLPRPRIELGIMLRGVATAAIDVSDGLVSDIGHICAYSGVAARIEQELAPLSEAARASLSADAGAMETILCGGDDYELAFTAPPGRADAIRLAAAGSGVPVTRIGLIETGSGVTVVDRAGHPVALPVTGYRHF